MGPKKTKPDRVDEKRTHLSVVPPPAEEPSARPPLKSRFAQTMQNFADELDRDIEALLKL